MRGRTLSDYQLPETEFNIGASSYRCTEIVYTGRHAMVVRVTETGTDTPFTLKVWRSQTAPLPTPIDIGTLNRYLRKVVGFTWLEQVVVLDPDQHGELLAAHPILKRAVLMPWLQQPTWSEFKFFYMHPQQPDRQKYFGWNGAAVVDTLPFARAFVRMLAQLEERGCVHHDLSDSNILLDLANNTVNCIDIDDLTVTARQSAQSSVCGTQSYQFHSDQDSVPNDRFAGALLLCEMLCVRELKYAGIYDYDGFFTPYELDTRSTTCARYTALAQALAELSPDLYALFRRLWTATSPHTLPAFWEWELAVAELSDRVIAQHVSPFKKYGWKVGASTRTPALIIFAIDVRQLEFSQQKNQDTFWSTLLYESILKMSRNSRVDRFHFSPRYHIALFTYGQSTSPINMLARLTSAEESRLTHHGHSWDFSHLGIMQLPELVEIFGQDEFLKRMNQQRNADVRSGKAVETHMTGMFETVYDLLQQVIDSYQECPPPLVYHITEGHNYDAGDPAGVVEKISALTTLYGHVQVATIHTGAKICVMPEDPFEWWGVRNERTFLPGNKALGTFLCSISTRLVDPKHFEFGYTSSKMQAGSYLLFPAEAEKLVRNAVTVAGLTRTGISPKHGSSIPIQVSR